MYVYIDHDKLPKFSKQAGAFHPAKLVADKLEPFAAERNLPCIVQFDDRRGIVEILNVIAFTSYRVTYQAIWSEDPEIVVKAIVERLLQ